MRSRILVNSLSGAAPRRGCVPTEPSQLRPVRKPRLHTPGPLVFLQRRRLEGLLQCLAQRIPGVERPQQLVLLTIETLVVDSVLVAVHAEKDVSTLHRSRHSAAARSLRTSNRVAGNALRCLPAMHVDHEVVDRMQQMQQPQMWLKGKSR